MLIRDKKNYTRQAISTLFCHSCSQSGLTPGLCLFPLQTFRSHQQPYTSLTIIHLILHVYLYLHNIHIIILIQQSYPHSTIFLPYSCRPLQNPHYLLGKIFIIISHPLLMAPTTTKSHLKPLHCLSTSCYFLSLWTIISVWIMKRKITYHVDINKNKNIHNLHHK